jgi:hypothetical protein
VYYNIVQLRGIPTRNRRCDAGTYIFRYTDCPTRIIFCKNIHKKKGGIYELKNLGTLSRSVHFERKNSFRNWGAVFSALGGCKYIAYTTLWRNTHCLYFVQAMLLLNHYVRLLFTNFIVETYKNYFKNVYINNIKDIIRLLICSCIKKNLR